MGDTEVPSQGQNLENDPHASGGKANNADKAKMSGAVPGGKSATVLQQVAKDQP